jgi:NAD(P)-dependent dehydrogenase (short-subunit alcohol dehydrogenase family)
MSNSDWLKYAGKRVIVSGCYSGIGQATARQLIELGADVHGVDWKACNLDLRSFTRMDLRDTDSIDAAIDRLDGGFDALFNCAGIPPGAPPLEVMAVNYLGARHLTDRLLPLLGDGGAIVNVASTGGMCWGEHLADLLSLVDAESFADGERWCAANSAMVAEGYRFSKEAVIVWTLSSAATLMGRGIRINCTLPGAVQTPMLVEIEKVTPTAMIDVVAQPIGRRSTPDEQATALLFLNSPVASYINGAVLPVDGGFMGATAIRPAR